MIHTCTVNTTVLYSEIKAIDLALDHIEQSRNSDFIIRERIFSDSLSVLQSLHNRRIENPLLLDVLLKHNGLAERNSIVFCWLPSHVGIRGNKKADIAAKSALTLNISDLKIPFTDFKPSINTFIISGRCHGMLPCLINFILSSLHLVNGNQIIE